MNRDLLSSLPIRVVSPSIWIALKNGIMTFPILLAALGAIPAAMAQQQTTEQEIHSMRHDMDELIKGQIELKKQVQELKTLLQASQTRPQTPPPKITFNLDGAPITGDKKARVIMIEFSDYQCSFCGRYATETYPRIEHEYINSGKIRYALRDFPLSSIHPLARQAAEAAECAGAQGALWTMRAELFANQGRLTTNSFTELAQQAGLDVDAFRRCLSTGQSSNTVTQAMTEGSRDGVTGTPTFFIGLVGTNSASVNVVKVIVGNKPYDAFKTALDSLLVAGKGTP
jgi:protein-disulfide isomerase